MFDYLYYRIYSTYKNKWNDSIPGVYAVCLISILQFFNLSCILFIGFYITDRRLITNKIFGALLVLVLIGINYYRFCIRSNYGLLENKWSDENKLRRTRNGILIVMYIVLSVLLFLLFANYLGRINRGL